MDRQFSTIELTDQFIKQGALLQLGPDKFAAFWGATAKSSNLNDLVLTQENSSENQLLVYNPDFWQFLDSDKTSNPINKFDHQINLNRVDLQSILLKHKAYLQEQSNFKTNIIKLQSADLEGFRDQFNWSQQSFTSLKGLKLQKTVPITQFNFTIDQDFNVCEALLQAINQPNFGWLYGQWTPQTGFVGMTPEILASWDGHHLQTMALAGTWDKSTHYKNFADVDLKTQHEHQFVVDDICRRLSDQSSKFSDLMISTAEVLNLPTLSHLKTAIQKQCSSVTEFIDKMQKLHPTAALGIYPRDIDKAQQFAKMAPQVDRKNFGSPFGVVGKNYGHIVVGIRNLRWDNENKSAKIFCGCGVTAESDFEKEWQELQLKMNSVLKAFNL